jgi:hypothetical protein
MTKATKDNNINTECALDVDKSICSNDATIKIVSEFIKKKKGYVISDEEKVISEAKEITQCNTEECALKKISKEIVGKDSFVIQENIDNNIKIDGPADSTAWLSNDNIDGVLKQLTTKHKYVKHIYFQMIDFKKNNTELNKINLLNDVLNSGYKKLCVVVNTDKLGGKGIHWFCIFCDLSTSGSASDPFTIEYFNSSGRNEPNAVADWCIREKCYIEEKSNFKASIVKAATVPHQIDTDSECGVYSIYYIHQRLNNAPISKFSTRIPDSEMIQFRKKLFRNRYVDPAS